MCHVGSIQSGSLGELRSALRTEGQAVRARVEGMWLGEEYSRQRKRPLRRPRGRWDVVQLGLQEGQSAIARRKVPP